MEPNYYAIIPANVRYDKRLAPNAKLLYGEITALANSTGYCFATNKYFADLYGVTGTSISLWVKSLIDCKYINSHIQYKEGTKEILKRYLSLAVVPIQDILTTPMQDNLKDNNTSSNTTSNNIIGSSGDSPTLFPPGAIPPVDKKKKKRQPSDEPETLFKNSTANNIEMMREKFKEWVDMGVDVDFYFHSVKDWSATKTKVFRTEDGWVATMRNFMRKDNTDKKLKFVEGSGPIVQDNKAQELEYLNMMQG